MPAIVTSQDVRAIMAAEDNAAIKELLAIEPEDIDSPDLNSLASADDTGIYQRSAEGVWSKVAIGAGITLANGTLSALSAADPYITSMLTQYVLTDYPTARVYRADAGVTSSGEATRHIVGTIAAATGILAANNLAQQAPLDGQGFAELANGRFLLAGGAPSGNAPAVVNTIWKSDDRGRTWSVLLANAAASSTRPAKAHTFGFFTMTIAGTEYVYWLGGDPFTPTGDVFRSADGGSTWLRISTTCPTSALALYNYGVLDDVIYVMGGQNSIEDTGVASNLCYKSVDFGVTWTAIGAAPWAGRGAQLGPMPVKDGKLWIIAGGKYDTVDNSELYNDVWTFDGTDWVEVLADGHAQFSKVRYHSAFVDSTGKLWIINGSTSDGVTLTPDTKSAYYSDDGATWTAIGQTLPWGNTHAQAAIVTSEGIYVTEGAQADKLHTILEFSGSLVSEWEDQGQDQLDLSQATNAKKPILAVNMFGSLPGIVGTRGQIMSLATPDRGITTGIFEAYVILKTLNFDTTAGYARNAPATLVGINDDSIWNGFGLSADAVRYSSAAPNIDTVAGSGVSDYETHVVGVQHTSEDGGTVRLFLDGEQVGSDETAADFSTDWIGWDSLLNGYQELDPAAAVLGMVIILRKHDTPTDDAFRAKLQTLAARWH